MGVGMARTRSPEDSAAARPPCSQIVETYANQGQGLGGHAHERSPMFSGLVLCPSGGQGLIVPGACAALHICPCQHNLLLMCAGRPVQLASLVQLAWQVV